MSNKKDIKIVKGNSDDLDISPVYNNVNTENPQTQKKKKHVVIPIGINQKYGKKNNKNSNVNNNNESNNNDSK